MVKITKLIVLITFLLVICNLYLPAQTKDLIPYPVGYRQWVHIMSALVGPESPFFKNSGGIHHIYANDKAMEGYKSGQFPDGSIIVADFLETQESKGITKEGPRRRIDVMVKDGKRYTETGGWGFEQFKGDSQTDRMVTAETAAKCFACHGTQKEHDSVFSKYRK
jgi:hypothetical protein